MSDITVVVVEIKRDAETVIKELTLTPEQQHIVTLIYADAQSAANLILADGSMTGAVKVAKLLSELMKILEKTKVNGTKLSGSTKKAVALELLKHLIRDKSPDAAELLSSAESIGEQLLETLADISRNLNMQVVEKIVETGCCGLVEVLMNFLKK